MSRVVEYEVGVDGETAVQTREGAKFLRADFVLVRSPARIALRVLALVDDAMPPQWRSLVSVRTDQHADGLVAATYVGSAEQRDYCVMGSDRARHVFDFGPRAAPGEEPADE